MPKQNASLTTTKNSVPAVRNKVEAFAPLIAAHLKRGVPITELACSDRDRLRLKAIFNCWDAYCRNPFTRAKDWFQWKESDYISNKFLPVALEIFEHIRMNYESCDAKHDKELAKWAARTAIEHAADSRDNKALVSGAKLLADLHNGFAEEGADERNKSRAALPIILVHATAKNPESMDYTDSALEEEMRKWNAAIDPTFQAIQDRTRQLEARSQEITDADFEELPQNGVPTPSQSPNGVPTPPSSTSSPFLTDDLFDEYD